MSDLKTLLLEPPFVDWIKFAAGSIVAFIVLKSTKKIVGNRIAQRAPNTATLIDDLFSELIAATQLYFTIALSLYLGSLFLELPGRVRIVVDKAAILVALLQLGKWAGIIVDLWVNRYLRVRADRDVASATTLGLISFAVRTLVFALIVLLILTNFGVDITALVAGLGVGGVAVALALQNILGDLFASLTIVLDKPFVVGDFIVVGGEFMGTIEHIGLKTVRVRSLSGEQLIFSNGDLLQSRIRNFKRMFERRVVTKIGVTYQTPEEKLRRIPKMIREVVEAREKTRFDRCHFLTYQASSLEYELVYWVLSPEFNTYADIAQEVNLGIFSRFAAEKIDFAYPTQTLFVQNVGEEEMPAP